MFSVDLLKKKDIRMNKKYILISILLTIFSLHIEAKSSFDKLVNQADAVIEILEKKEYEKLCDYIEETNGLYIADAINIPFKNYNYFTFEQIKNISNEEIINIRINDDIQESWNTSILNYFKKRFDISRDRLNKKSINKFITDIDWYMGKESILNELKDVYFVEYYFSPSGKYGDIDWLSVYVIFQKNKNDFKLIAITRNYAGA